MAGSQDTCFGNELMELDLMHLFFLQLLNIFVSLFSGCSSVVGGVWFSPR